MNKDLDEFDWDEGRMAAAVARSQAERIAMKDYEDEHPESASWTYGRLRDAAYGSKGMDE